MPTLPSLCCNPTDKNTAVLFLEEAAKARKGQNSRQTLFLLPFFGLVAVVLGSDMLCRARGLRLRHVCIHADVKVVRDMSLLVKRCV